MYIILGPREVCLPRRRCAELTLNNLELMHEMLYRRIESPGGQGTPPSGSRADSRDPRLKSTSSRFDVFDGTYRGLGSRSCRRPLRRNWSSKRGSPTQ